MCCSRYVCGNGYIRKERIYFQDKLDEFVDLLKYFDLPTEVSGLDRENVYNQLFHDKKVSGNKLKFVIADKIGSTIRTSDVEKEEIMTAIDYILK